MKAIKKIWYLVFPTFLYVEDVKALAKEHDLQIIDASVTADRSNAAESVPKVTLKSDQVKNEVQPTATREQLDKAIAELPGDQTNPDYVVGAMRDFFKDVFTDDDEAKIRELVIAPPKKASEGLTVPQLRDALAVKKIEIPAGMTKKEDLANLLDESKD